MSFYKQRDIEIMKWFKVLNPKSDEMLDAKKVVGDAGLWQISCAVAEAISLDISDLTVDHISGFIKVKRDRAEKLLPFAQKILSKSSEIFGKSQKILSKSSEISENLEKSLDFSASNPHGSTRNQEENREDKKRVEETHTKEKVCVLTPSDFSKNGLTIAQKSNNANMQNLGWVTGYLDGVRSQYKDKSDEVLLSVWLEVCTSASAQGIGHSQWYMKAFQNKVAAWKPGHSPPKQQNGLTLGNPKIVPNSERKGGIVEV